MTHAGAHALARPRHSTARPSGLSAPYGHKAYGAGDPDVLFKGAPKTTAAWPGAGKKSYQSASTGT